jgi:hypothetical protein
VAIARRIGELAPQVASDRDACESKPASRLTLRRTYLPMLNIETSFSSILAVISYKP